MTDAPPPPDAAPDPGPAEANDAPSVTDPAIELEPRAGWSPRRRALTWGGVGLVGVLVVGGATGAIIAAASPQPVAIVEQTDQPDPRPTPTDDRHDEFDIVDPPEPILKANCSDLLSSAAIASTFTTDNVILREDVDSPPVHEVSANYRQAGATYCRWGGENRTDGGYDAGIDVVVLPDGADYYFTNIRPESLIDVDYTVVDSHGDASTYRCGVWGSYYCVGDMVVGDYWVHLYVSGGDITDATEPHAHAVIERVLAEVEGGVRGAGEPRDPWRAPDHSYTGASICALPVAQASEISGIPGLEVPPPPMEGDYPAFETAVHQRLQWGGCSWWVPATGAYFSVAVLSGGAWSVSAMTDPGDSYYEIQEWPHEDIEGTDDALVGCNGSWCSAFLGFEGSRIGVHVSGPTDRAAFIAVLNRLMAAID